jgi:uncharacterized membrane protein (DUF106 family)
VTELSSPVATGPVTIQKKKGMSTFWLFASFGVVILIMFNETLRNALGIAVGFVLQPTIGFRYSQPILTILLASVILVVATTAIRHYLVDWVNMARVQQAMRDFQKEFSAARKENNTYKLKKLTDAQPEIMAMQAQMSTEQMKPMAFTMLLVIPIFAWLYTFISGADAVGNTFVRVPWDTHYVLSQTRDNWWQLKWFPRWILLYSLFGIPFGQIAQRALKMWEYRHHDLDGDGKTPAETA